MKGVIHDFILLLTIFELDLSQSFKHQKYHVTTLIDVKLYYIFSFDN